MESEIHNLSKGQRVALWVAFTWVLFCLLGAFGNGWFLLIVICLALLAAICCLFKRILDAKYAWAVFAASIIIPGATIGALTDPEDSTPKQTVEKQEDPKTPAKKEAPQKSTEAKAEKEEKEQESPLSPREKEVANAGFKRGIMFGMAGASNEEFSNMLDAADYLDDLGKEVDKMYQEMAGREYDNEYNAPTNAEEEKLKKIYIENFRKGMESTMEGMDKLEKLGGKRK